MNYIDDLKQHLSTYTQLDSEQKHTRCSGCGNYGILHALMRAISLEGYQAHEVILANDVGCSGNVSDKIETYTIHGLHGRVLPLAAGIHCARPDLPVIAMAGDGATLSEGINHLIHLARNNYNITFILHNNHNYALTTGQASAATFQGTAMKGTVGEVTATPLEPLKLVLTAGGGFAARGWSGDVTQLTQLIRAGMNYTGFSIIEVLQHCPTYSKATPVERYEEKVYDVADDPSYSSSDKWEAMSRVEEYDRLATGILYKDETILDFMSLQAHRHSIASTPVQEVYTRDITDLLHEFVL